MTQSLIDNGKEGNSSKEKFEATPKWICAEDFKPRPENETGANRVELARHKETGEHMTVVYSHADETFVDAVTCQVYIPGALEIKIVEIR
jgi:hypothetical protein